MSIENEPAETGNGADQEQATGEDAVMQALIAKEQALQDQMSHNFDRRMRGEISGTVLDELNAPLYAEHEAIHQDIRSRIENAPQQPQSAELELAEQSTVSGTESVDVLNERIRREEITLAQDFRDLIVNHLQRHDDWKYSNGDPLDKDELIQTINEVRLGRKGINYVTSRYGLRAKVAQLLEQQQSQA